METPVRTTATATTAAADATAGAQGAFGALSAETPVNKGGLPLPRTPSGVELTANWQRLYQARLLQRLGDAMLFPLNLTGLGVDSPTKRMFDKNAQLVSMQDPAPGEYYVVDAQGTRLNIAVFEQPPGFKFMVPLHDAALEAGLVCPTAALAFVAWGLILNKVPITDVCNTIVIAAGMYSLFATPLGNLPLGGSTGHGGRKKPAAAKPAGSRASGGGGGSGSGGAKRSKKAEFKGANVTGEGFEDLYPESSVACGGDYADALDDVLAAGKASAKEVAAAKRKATAAKKRRSGAASEERAVDDEDGAPAKKSRSSAARKRPGKSAYLAHLNMPEADPTGDLPAMDGDRTSDTEVYMAEGGEEEEEEVEMAEEEDGGALDYEDELGDWGSRKHSFFMDDEAEEDIGEEEEEDEAEDGYSSPGAKRENKNKGKAKQKQQQQQQQQQQEQRDEMPDSIPETPLKNLSARRRLTFDDGEEADMTTTPPTSTKSSAPGAPTKAAKAAAPVADVDDFPEDTRSAAASASSSKPVVQKSLANFAFQKQAPKPAAPAPAPKADAQKRGQNMREMLGSFSDGEISEGTQDSPKKAQKKPAAASSSTSSSTSSASKKADLAKIASAWN